MMWWNFPLTASVAMIITSPSLSLPHPPLPLSGRTLKSESLTLIHLLLFLLWCPGLEILFCLVRCLWLILCIYTLGAYRYIKFHYIRLVLKSMSNTNTKYHENYSRNVWSSCKLHHMSLATLRESNTPRFSASRCSSISTRLKQRACITWTSWMEVSLTAVIDICLGEVHYKRHPDMKNTEGPAHSRSMLTLRHEGPEGNGGEASLNSWKITASFMFLGAEGTPPLAWITHCP